MTLLLAMSLLVACSENDSEFGNSGLATNVPVQGGGVKGPLANADVALYALDLSADDLKGAEIATGTTGSNAQITDLEIPSNTAGLVLMEFTVNDETTDISSGQAPVLSGMTTVLNLDSTPVATSRLFASPLTTVAVSLAASNADSTTLPYAGNGDGTTTDAEFIAAMAVAGGQVASSLGFGLGSTINIFTQSPLLTSDTSDGADQAGVIAYRQAIEALSAVVMLMVSDATANNPNTTLSADRVITSLSRDLADGTIDGMSGAEAIDDLGDVSSVATILTTDVTTLMIPGTNILVSATRQVLVDELATTGESVTTTGIESGEITASLAPGRAISDIDGDGVTDTRDAFPLDASESSDLDADGTGDNADSDDDNDGTPDDMDAFPADASEQLDTDGDGIGNNTDTDDDGDGVNDSQDALPLDASETTDTDGDGVGNNADTDDDGDGVSDTDDDFPLDRTESADTDMDGVGNNEDTDDDGDGVADTDDDLPLDPNGSVATSTTIGSDGGEATSADGLFMLSIPANALDTDTVITIGTPTAGANELYTTDDGTFDALYLLGPAGQQFSQPVTATYTVPESTGSAGAIRMAVIVDDAGSRFPDEPVTTNVSTGQVSAQISHFTDVVYLQTGLILGISRPSATLGNTLNWNYSINVDQDIFFGGEANTEGAAIFDENGNFSLLVPPEILSGDDVIDNLAHITPVIIEFTADGTEQSGLNDGLTTATCIDASETGLEATIGFNVQWRNNMGLPQDSFFPSDNIEGIVRVEATGTCIESVIVTEPTFTEIGDQVDRINVGPPPPYTETTCGEQAFIAVSDTQTSIFSADGSCSEDITRSPGSGQLGALLLQDGNVERLLTHFLTGLSIGIPEEGFFAQFFGNLFGSPTATTDAQHCKSDTGETDYSCAFTVTGGTVHKYSPSASQNAIEEEVFSSFGNIPDPAISYSPLGPNSGLVVSSSSPSHLYLVDLIADTATELGEVGDGALNVKCTYLNEITSGCVATAYTSKELFPVFVSPGQVPIANLSAPVTGISTASPFVWANDDGQMVIASVNDNEAGKVRLQVYDSDTGAETLAEFFLTDFTDDIGFSAIGSSIVLVRPSEKYPNGAIIIGADNPSGTNDGVLTIPVTEALLGSSPAAFFGAAVNGAQ